jgi:BirA family biotin operon repressor/biotin-[acetyl-CoA-carboxylase] ligase
MADRLSVVLIQSGLDTRKVGTDLVYFDEIGSTNDWGRKLAQSGAQDGTVVFANHQTAGRGRLDRRWEAPAGSSLLLSVIFRPDLAAHQAQRLTMISGLAVADAVEAETGLPVKLKWPNDIVVQGGKAGGILTEVGLSGQRIDYAVVGIGLNVNLDSEQLPPRPLVPATSLSQSLGHAVERLSLLRALLRAIDARYLALQSGRSPHEEWAARLTTLGQPVIVSSADTSVEGVAEAVDDDGALLVRLADGRLETVFAGDVTLRVPGRPDAT